MAQEAVIVSLFVTRRRALQMLPHLKGALAHGVAVVVVTRPANADDEKAQPACCGKLFLWSHFYLTATVYPVIR
jgi:hypothetical protein